VDQDLALGDTIGVRTRQLCGSPHAESARRIHCPIATTPDAFALAARDRECLIEIKEKRDARLALEQLSCDLLACASAAPSVDSALDEQLLGLP